MRRRPLIALVALAVLGGLATAGCGDDDSSTTAAEAVTGFSGEAPTDSISYHLAADKYCRQAENELDEAASEQFGDQQPSPEDLEAFVNDYYVPIMRRQIEQIRTIPIPAGEEDAVNQINDAFDDGLAEAEADPGSLADGPPLAIVEASRLAAEYGFDDCGLDT